MSHKAMASFQMNVAQGIALVLVLSFSVVSSSDYLGITILLSELTDNYELMNGNDMLPPILKKTAGAMSIKRKKSSSETATTSNTGHSC